MNTEGKHEAERTITNEVEEFIPLELPTIQSAQQAEEQDRLSSQHEHELPQQNPIKISTVAAPEWGNQSRSIKEGS